MLMPAARAVTVISLRGIGALLSPVLLLLHRKAVAGSRSWLIGALGAGAGGLNAARSARTGVARLTWTALLGVSAETVCAELHKK
jgi:hypothetical protein